MIHHDFLGGFMRVIPLKETALLLGLSPLSLADKRYRTRLGLPAVRVGRKLGFEETDVEALILRGRESIPVEGEAHDELVRSPK
jgi:hypothetical protein